MTGILQSLLGSVSSAAASATDAFFNLVTLLLPGNGTNGAQNNTFLDSSSNNFTITRNGNTTQGTFSPFSQTGWSVFLDGSGDYLTGNGSLTTSTSQSSMTVEGWFYPTTFANKIWLVGDMDPTGATNVISVAVTTAGLLEFYWYDGNGKFANSTTALSLNQWNWFAVVVNSNAISMYVNSTTSGQTGTTTLTNRTQGANFAIGAWSNSATPNGYISNLRWSTSARTISSIPTAPYTSDANTRLLTCQSNRFVDNSSNGFTLTPSGNTSVQAFSPFLPTAAYSAATVGGSGYFDGTGDYLTVADNAALEPVGNNFCIELSYYPTSVSGTKTILGKRSNPSTDYGFLVLADGANARVYISSANTSYDIVNGTIIGTLVTNQWHHIAIYRISNAWYASFNGSITTLNASNSSSVNNNAGTWGIGADSNGAAPVQGYMANTRFVIGSSVYTSTSAPFPTAPLTAITNTSLLLNFTNAGITDATAKNVLETVGNAQISTTQSKFGGSSIYLDGTGDYLTLPTTNQSLTFGSANWTIEFWIYVPTLPSARREILYLNGNTSGYAAVALHICSNNKLGLSFSESGSSWRADDTTGVGTALSATTWQYVAVTRNGQNIQIYLDGAAQGSAYTTTASTTSLMTTYTLNQIGTYNTASFQLNAYIDDLRITLGQVRTVTTSPTVAFPLQ